MRYRREYDIRMVGQNLRRLREAKNLTVEEVRAYLQLGSVQAVYKYAAGRSYLPTDAMFALMQLYQADLYDILCDCEKRPALESVRITQVQRSRRVNKFWEVYKDYLHNNAG